MKKRKAIKSSIGWLLAGAQVASDGLSSARQIVDFTPSPYARYAACSATIVEGEIYRKNIIEGISRFSLLSEKTLWEYLIIEKVESDLQINNIREKKLRENIIKFFKEIINCVDGKYQLNDEEEKFFLDYTSKKNFSAITEDDRNEIYEFFKKLVKDRAQTSKFIFPRHIDEFKKLNDEYEALIEARKIRCPLLISYNACLEFFKQSKLSHENVSHTEQAEKDLKLLRKQLVKSVIEPGSCQVLIDSGNLNPALIDELREEVSKKAIKLWPLRFGMLFSLGVGVCIGVITFYTFPAVLVGFGLTSLTILSTVIWPLAILAAISYAILIYNTITDLILNETLSKWLKELNAKINQKNGSINFLKYSCLVIGKSLAQLFAKLVNWFKFQEQESYSSYIFRMLLSTAVLVFGIIAALTTGYTAFIQLKDFVSLPVCVITALPLMLSDLLFTLKNSFETLGLLTGISINNLLNPIKKFNQDLKSQIAKENYLQCLLYIFRIPLRLVLSVLKLLIFGFHVIFTAVASDRFFNFPCWLTVFFAAGSELLTDICPLFGNNQGDHHDHNHGGIFNFINKIIFILPATILGILNCLFSQLNRREGSNIAVLTLREAIKQEWRQFDIIHEHFADNANLSNESAPTLPKEVVKQKAIHICDKEISRLEKSFFSPGLAKQKADIFSAYKIKLAQNIQIDSNNDITLENKKIEILQQHRFFKKEKTESMRKLKKIEDLIRPFMINDNNHVSNGHARAL